MGDGHGDHPSKRQTTIITEYFDQPTQDQGVPEPPQKGSVHPSQVPLPRSRSNTLTSTVPNGPLQPLLPHQIPLPHSRPNTAASVLPHNVPLPRPKSQAPTVYTAEDRSPPMPQGPQAPTMASYAGTKGHRRHQSMPHPSSTVEGTEREKTLRTMPSVSVIDYAARQPLPDSRPTSFFGTPKAAAPMTVSYRFTVILR